MRKHRLILTLFGEEGAGAAPVSAGEGTGVSGIAAGNEVGAESAGQTVDTAQEEAQRPSFEDLIKGDYKREADQYIQNLIRGRVKKANATIAEQRKILSVVAGKYGLDGENLDLAALGEKVSADDAYYEERAMEEGLTVDQYKRIANAEARNREYEAQFAEQQREQQAQEQVRQWQAQAEQVKQTFPDFDLRAEMQNPTFQNLLRTGVDMQSAYVALHNAEILQGAMRYTASEVRKATAQDIAARGQRPREAASSSQAAATTKVDVSKLTKADREALSRRAAAGEIITFT